MKNIYMDGIRHSGTGVNIVYPSKEVAFKFLNVLLPSASEEFWEERGFEETDREADDIDALVANL